MIPQVEPCRFMTIATINKKVADNSFSYNSVRVVGKVSAITPQAFRLVAEDPSDPTQTIDIDIFLLKGKQIEKGKIYEFLGEIEANVHTTTAAAAQNNGANNPTGD